MNMLTDYTIWLPATYTVYVGYTWIVPQKECHIHVDLESLV